MAYQLKLTRNGETRRLTFDAQPMWNALQAKVSSLFKIRPDGVAVSYEDSDGDVVTMSSQEELLDYFQNCYKPGQIAKFTVVDKSHSQRVRVDDTEDIDAESDGDLPTMGPTMFIEVDDGGWQRLPRMPGLYGIREEEPQTLSEQGAFVEVVDSESEGAQKDINNASAGRISPRQSRYKGKEKAAVSEATGSVSSVSVVDNDAPTKPSVHVYDVSGAGDSVQGHHEVGQQKGPGVEKPVRSFGIVYPASPPQDAFKGIPRASEYFDARRPKEHDGLTSVGSDLNNSAVPPPEDLQSLDLESNIRANNETVGSRTPTLGQASTLRSSFVHDVADLVDNLTHAFASHPELSEGFRNIVRKAVGGRYWNAERERMASVADNVRAAAEETSTRITESVGNMANNAERDAVRVIAEALGGVFRVIGELSRPTTEPPTADVPRGGPDPPPPRPQHLHDSYSTRSDRRDLIAPLDRHDRPENAARYVPPGAGFGYHPSGMEAFRPSYSREFGPKVPQSQTNETWMPGSHGDQHLDRRVNDDAQGATSRSNIHETKATLEAAKRIYKAEKERFRAEKEEHRRMRRDVAERRVEANRIQRPDGTIREEEIVGRLPLRNPSRGGHLHRPYSEVYDGLRSSNARVGMHRPLYAPPPPATLLPRGISGTSNSMYSTEEPMPAVPPAPVPAPVAVSPVPSAPVIPPPPPVPPASVTRPVPGSSNNVNPMPDASQIRSFGPGPFPWPVPPVRDPSRRKHLSTLRERIQARLFNMGITPASQPDMQDILNVCTSRTDAPEDDEVLADVLSAMNIRGSPSPRAGTSGLPR